MSSSETTISTQLTDEHLRSMDPNGVPDYARIDPEHAKEVLSSPPFIAIEGVINFRDFGGVPVSAPTSPLPGQPQTLMQIKPLVLFRSGELTRLTERGKLALEALGIKTVFDLRNDVELDKYDSVSPEVRGVRHVRVPMPDADEHDEAAQARRVASFAEDDKAAFAREYTRILRNACPAYMVILRHMLEHPGEPVLVHCTAGKDRSGMFAAIVQMLLGASDEAIANDYHLTRYGLFPVVPLLIPRFWKEPMYRDNWEGFLKMGNCRKETMLMVLGIIREEFGGIEAYVKEYLALSDEEIAQLRRDFVVPTARQE